MSDQPMPPAVESPIALQRLRDKGIHSVFDVVREGRDAFIARMAVDTDGDEAGQLYELAMTRALGVARLHTSLLAREEPAKRSLPKLASGGARERMEALSLGGSGDYEMWFGRTDLFAAPDSVASLFSPASYLVDLYRVAVKLHPKTSPFHIDKRRADLAGLVLSQDRMTTELPTLQLVSEILADGIEASVPGDDSADAIVASAVYPFGLPYDRRGDEISQGLIALGTDEKRVRDRLGALDEAGLTIGGDMAKDHRSRYPAEVVRAGLALSPGEYALIIALDPTPAPGHWGDAILPIASVPELLALSGLSLAEVHEVLATERALRDNDTRPAHALAYGASYLNHGLQGEVPPTLNLIVSTSDTDSYGRLENNNDPFLYERLQRLIRLKACIPLTYEEIDWLWAQSGDTAPGLKATLRGIAVYLPLRERLGLSVDAFAAIVGRLNPYARPGTSSLLSQRFQPGFAAYLGSKADFGMAAPANWDTPAGRIAQGLGIDQQTLRSIAYRVAGVAPADVVLIAVTEDFLASLYRIVEIPRLAGLTTGEGLTLWSCMDEGSNAIVSALSLTRGAELYDSAQYILLATLQASDWLREHAIDTPTLMALTTTQHRKAATTEMLEFIANLHASASGDTANFASAVAAESALIDDQLARHVGAQFGLTAGIAKAMIHWIDKVIGQMDPELAGYSSDQFWKDIASPYRASAPVALDEIGPKIVQFCHLLGQFALACHVTGLQEQDIALIVAPREGPSRLYGEAIPPLTLESIFWLLTYTDWRDALPGSAAEARLHLGTRVASRTGEDASHTLAQFAELNGWNPELATGVWKAIGHPPLTNLDDMRYVHQLGQWMRVALDLQLSPDKLTAIRSLVTSQDPATNEAQRATLSPAILAAARSAASALKPEELDEQLAEHRRDALLRYYLRYVVPASLRNRIQTADDLYEYMLIDAQVSARVTTSRIAEAIAGVQLYLHRCREGVDPEVEATALANEMRPGGYFDSWDAYNKRYGTWAGLQRLLRYPGSYLDPSLRYTKTRAFLVLEDALNQGRLTTQRADAALQAFLDTLREMLDIEDIDGYQLGTGTESATVFLGRAKTSPARYFWRQTYPATTECPGTWSEWLPVDANIPLYRGSGEQPFIVYFAGAIRVVWGSWRTSEATASTTGNNNASLKQSQDLDLHVATLRNDGSWQTRSYPGVSIVPGPFSLEFAYVGTYGDGHAERLLVYIPTTASQREVGTSCILDPFLNLSAGSPEADTYSFPSQTFYGARFIRCGIVQDLVSTITQIEPTDAYEMFSRKNGLEYNIVVKSGREKLAMIFHVKIPDGPTYVEIIIDLPAGEIWTSSRIYALTSGTAITGDYSSVGGTPGPVKVTVRSCEAWTAKPHLFFNFYSRWPGIIDFTVTGGPKTRIATCASAHFQRQYRSGIDTLLSYATQTDLVDPNGMGDAPAQPIPWTAGMGVYMWELFFHAPFLIACRLLDEQRFDEAEVWLRRIFSPSGYVDAEGKPKRDSKGNILYWNVLPLQEDTTWGPNTSQDTDDPDVVAMDDPMHYKLAVYLRWMQLYRDRGDMAYRQQTRDTMGEAKMWYVQAMQLLGRRPYFHNQLAGYWKDPTLAVAATSNAPALDALDAIIGDTDLLLTPTHPGQARVVDGVFLPPVDDDSLVWWDRFALRLYNLRHGLSLDGQPLLLPLFETPVSPRELQQRRLAADAGAGGLNPGTVTLPGFRFIVLLDRARSAVLQLMQFGSTLQGILERRDTDALNVLQQTQAVQLHVLASEAHALQGQILEHTATSLQLSRAQAGERQRHYASLASQYMNTAEIASMGMRTAAPLLLHGSVGATIAAAALDMVPNTWIAGMAAGVGGTTWSAVARATAEGLTTEANALELNAGTLDMVAGFQRRREEWQLQGNQAAFEVAQLDTQIAANAAAHEQALKQATQLDVEHGYAQAVLDTLTTRFTGKDLFNWQAARVSTLYYQLYDATLSLCGWAQKAYQFETGDGSTFLQPGAWDDRYQGLLAGESLALGLQRLERAHLTWDQRALEVERTLSLGALADQSLGDLIEGALDTRAPAAESGKLTVGYENDVLTLSFVLQDAGILDDYPTGMQLGTKRRIKSIAVTLPALLGPYEDIRAVLGYAGGAAAQLPSGCTAVALSRGLADSGQFVLDFNDGKYLPFEGIPVDDTGTLSLRFPNGMPRKQEDMLRSITDVILHVRYTIRKDGTA